MAHRLQRLLNPRTIAIVGASERSSSLAAITHRQLLDCGFEGDIFSVNPKYSTLLGQPCYPCLGDLPGVPDLVIYAISGLALEQSFSEALAMKVGGILIYAANTIENDIKPPLTERLRQAADRAGIPVCGGNSMGFYNYDNNIMVSFDRPPAQRPAGHIALLAHSGSGMTYLANNDARFCFNYVIASGQEINGSVGDYMDYLLQQPSTRVIALILEAVRDVPGFVAALHKAQLQRIPVLVTRLGRTEKSAQLALSHSGAIVGDYEALVAVCRRYGALLCQDMDEMIVTAMLFASGRRAAAGGLASMLDSGGMREQMIDLAEHYALRFAQISPQTTAVLQANLEAGLEAVNPMDGMGALGKHSAQTFLECGKALLDDSDTGLLSFEFEFRDDFSHYPELFDVTRELAGYSDLPVVLINSSSLTNTATTAAEMNAQGIPVINGIDVALRALRNLMQYRAASDLDQSRQKIDLPQQALSHWCGRLSDSDCLDEITALQMMSDFGLPSVRFESADNLQQLRLAAETCGYPLVMKTAMPGIAHKSDQGGVKLGITDDRQLQNEYLDLQQRLGERVVVMPMVAAGIEVSIGMKNDVQFGPLVIVACGGLLIELLAERSFELAPVNIEQANAMIERTRLSQLLAGVRGSSAVDREALLQLIVRFSQLAFELGDSIAEIDLNPVIVNATGCTIVDALVVPARSGLS